MSQIYQWFGVASYTILNYTSDKMKKIENQKIIFFSKEFNNIFNGEKLRDLQKEDSM